MQDSSCNDISESINIAQHISINEQNNAVATVSHSYLMQMMNASIHVLKHKPYNNGLIIRLVLNCHVTEL